VPRRIPSRDTLTGGAAALLVGPRAGDCGGSGWGRRARLGERFARWARARGPGPVKRDRGSGLFGGGGLWTVRRSLFFFFSNTQESCAFLYQEGK